jgi:hypothetical protein
MKIRKFFLISLLLILSGIFAHLIAFSYAAEGLKWQTVAREKPLEAVRLRILASKSSHRTDLALYIGIACAILKRSFCLYFLCRGRTGPAFDYSIVACFIWRSSFLRNLNVSRHPLTVGRDLS